MSKSEQLQLQLHLQQDEASGISTVQQQYDTTSVINEVRRLVGLWRAVSNPSEWHVTPATARLLQHWRFQAKVVITHYHAFKLRERIELSKGGRQLLQGRTGDDLKTLETEGQIRISKPRWNLSSTG